MTWRNKASLLSLLIIAPLIANALLISEVKAHPTRLSIDPPSLVDTAKVPGTQFSVNLMVDTVTDLWLFNFELTFNPDVVQGVWYDEGSGYPVEIVYTFLESAGGFALPSPGQGWNNTIGKLWLNGAFLTDKDPATCPDGGPGLLATITFEVVGKGETDIRLGELTELMGPYDNYIIQGRDYVDDGYFRNIDSAQIPTASFTAAPQGTPSEQGPLEGYNTGFDGTSSTAPGGKTITTYKWFFWKTLQGLFYDRFPSGQSPLVTGPSTVTRNFTLRGTWPVTLTVIDSDGVVDSTTVDVLIKAHDVYFAGIETNALPATWPGGVPYVNIGETIVINVNATNEGDFTETFDVTCFWSVFDAEIGDLRYGSLGTQNVASLAARANSVLTFYWNTDGYNITHPEAYGIHANASVVLYEYDKERATGKIADNEYVGEGHRIRFHDIAVTAVTPTTKTVTPGEIVQVDVTLVNQGDFSETQIRLTAYYNDTLLGAKTVYLLTNSSYGIPPRFPTINHTATITFSWDTTGIPAGYYELSAEASVVAAEYDLFDNAYGRPYRPMVSYHVFTWDFVDYYVGIVSDSTVSDVAFSGDDKELSFNVTGELGGKGYFSVAIPKNLLWGTFVVQLNGTTVDYTIAENVTHYFIYITYEFASTWSVIITGEWVVPEFAEAMIVPTLILATLVAIVLCAAGSKKLRGLRRCSAQQTRP